MALDRLMQFLQNAAAPCALFVLGVTVALRPMPRLTADVPAIIPVKLILHPLIVFFVLAWLGPFTEAWTYAAILMAALPPALNVFVLARQYDVWLKEASGSVLLGTLVSVVTLTGVMYLLKSGSFRRRRSELASPRGRPLFFGFAQGNVMTQPLSGITVLDLTNLLPGPLATLMLSGGGRAGHQDRAARRRRHAPLCTDLAGHGRGLRAAQCRQDLAHARPEDGSRRGEASRIASRRLTFWLNNFAPA